MVSGFAAYRQVLSDPRARAFSAAGFVARLPMSMTGIGTVLLVSLTTGSFGRAGLITAAGTLVGALAAPLWGRVIDRVGQARVLLVAAATYVVGVTGVIVSVLDGWVLAASLLLAAVAGLGFTSAGACVRARWTHRLADSPLLNTAFAVEAVLDELVFIVGPVLVTFLATAVHPALGLGLCAVFGLVGAVLLAAQRGTEPPLRPPVVRAERQPIGVAVLAPIVVACWAVGCVFGGMEVVVVAFAREAGVLEYAGVLLMAWALGSLAAGVVVGLVHWRRPPALRFRIGAVALALSVLPLPFVSSPVLMGVLLTVSGFAIAPSMIAAITTTQAAVPPARLTEALGWTSTGIAAGVATGAAVLGQLIDLDGATAGFWGVVGAGGVLIVAALFVRVRPAASAEPQAGSSVAR